MKILIISPSQEGTIARCSKNLVDAFIANDKNTVKVIALHKGAAENLLGECECFDDTPKSAFMNLFSLVNKIKWVKQIKKQFKPDVTISTLTGCSTYNVLGTGTGKTIGIFHSPTDQLKTHYINYLMAEFCFKHVYNKLDGLFCVSDEVTTYLQQHYKWIGRNKIKTVYNIHPVSLIRDKSMEKLDKESEEKFFYNNDVYLYCGRLDVNKSPKRLLKSFAQSNLIDSNSAIAFMGSEWDYSTEDIYHISAELGIRAHVLCIGSKSNPYKYMKRSKFLVSTSKSEGLPGVIIESLILGVAVITTNSTHGVWEIFNETDSYIQNLNTIHVCPDGIITPNLPDEDKNVEELTNAFNISQSNIFEVPFPFIEKIKAENIINEYINIQ